MGNWGLEHGGAAAAPHLSPFQAAEECLAWLRCQGSAPARELLRDMADRGARSHRSGFLLGLWKTAGAGDQQLPASLHCPLHREQLHDCHQKVIPALAPPSTPMSLGRVGQACTPAALGPSAPSTRPFLPRRVSFSCRPEAKEYCHGPCPGLAGAQVPQGAGKPWAGGLPPRPPNI